MRFALGIETVSPSVRSDVIAGTRKARQRALTQTQCRYRATKSRSSHEPRAASPAMSVICQRELSRNVNGNWLLILIGFLLDLLHEFLQAREFLGREVFGFDKTHDETLR